MFIRQRIITAIITLIGIVALMGSAQGQNETEDINRLVLDGAKKELSNKTKYNTDMLATYFGTKYKNGVKKDHNVYPGGDVNPNEGVCTDLVVRACRHAGFDLQKEVHEDIIKNKRKYGVTTPDKYIDHRRVWILLRYFKKNFKSLTKNVKDSLSSWQAGDIVMFDIGSRDHFHIGVVSDSVDSDSKRPKVIHNMSYIPTIFPGETCEMDILDGVRVLGLKVYDWKVIGHFRLSEKK